MIKTKPSDSRATPKWIMDIFNAHIFYCAERLAFTSHLSDVNYKSPFPSIIVTLSGIKKGGSEKA